MYDAALHLEGCGVYHARCNVAYSMIGSVECRMQGIIWMMSLSWQGFDIDNTPYKPRRGSYFMTVGTERY